MVWLAQENILFLINLRRRKKKNQLHNPLIHSTDTASWSKTKSTLQFPFIYPNSAFFAVAVVTPCFLPWASWACAHLLWAVFHSGGVVDQSHHRLFFLAYIREEPCRDKLSIMSKLCSDTVRRRPSGKEFPILRPKLCSKIREIVTKVKKTKVFSFAKVFLNTLATTTKKWIFSINCFWCSPAMKKILLLSIQEAILSILDNTKDLCLHLR